MGTKLGIQAELISTHLDFIADDISRLKQEDKNGDFDYSSLKLTYPTVESQQVSYQYSRCPTSGSSG